VKDVDLALYQSPKGAEQMTGHVMDCVLPGSFHALVLFGDSPSDREGPSIRPESDRTLPPLHIYLFTLYLLFRHWEDWEGDLSPGIPKYRYCYNVSYIHCKYSNNPIPKSFEDYIPGKLCHVS
jgi:hypothetical protein